jgi:hypothetical protein
MTQRYSRRRYSVLLTQLFAVFTQVSESHNGRYSALLTQAVLSTSRGAIRLSESHNGGYSALLTQLFALLTQLSGSHNEGYSVLHTQAVLSTAAAIRGTHAAVLAQAALTPLSESHHELRSQPTRRIMPVMSQRQHRLPGREHTPLSAACCCQCNGHTPLSAACCYQYNG